MTSVGVGGIAFDKFRFKKRFQKELNGLDPQLKKRALEKIEELLSNPFPPGLGFEKLKGYSKPNVYSIHVTGNYKISLEVLHEEDKKTGEKSCIALLRRIACHNEIDHYP